MPGRVNFITHYVDLAMKEVSGANLRDDEIWEAVLLDIQRLHQAVILRRDECVVKMTLEEKGERARAKQVEAMRKEQQERRVQKAQEEYRARIARGLSREQGDASREVLDGREDAQD